VASSKTSNTEQGMDKAEVEEPDMIGFAQKSMEDFIASEDERDRYYQRKREEEIARDKKVQNQLLADLSEPFPPEIERELKKGGTFLTYIPVSEVITRLNKVFGITGWSSEIIKCERDALDPDFIVAHVRLKIHPTSQGPWNCDGLQKDGFGGQKIKRTKQGEIVDLGDEFKGAVSDALKKAAQQLGVALYLSRSDEALSLEIEQEMAMNRPQVDPKVAALWNQFRDLSSTFTADQKAQLSNFWNEYSNGAPKPSPETATPQIMMALIEECTRISFPGSSILAVTE
jgi:recombination DNA repair RAD52 pathway protein